MRYPNHPRWLHPRGMQIASKSFAFSDNRSSVHIPVGFCSSMLEIFPLKVYYPGGFPVFAQNGRRESAFRAQARITAENFPLLTHDVGKSSRNITVRDVERIGMNYTDFDQVLRDLVALNLPRFIRRPLGGRISESNGHRS